MNTTEHTELGDALRFQNWDTLQGSPYILTVYTKRAYAPSPDKNEKPVEAGGDGDFDEAANSLNKFV